MPRVSHLRSDYPLTLTLLEHAHACPSTCFYIAGLTPRTVLTSPLRLNSRLPISFYQRYCTNSWSFACAPFACKSQFGLTPARASLQRVPASYRREFDDSHRTPKCKSTQLNTPAWPASSLLRKSLAVPLLGPRSAARNGRSAVSCVAPVSRCPWTSEQVKSDKEEHMMSQSRGAVSFEPLFTAEEIGLGKEAHVEHVMKVFVTLGEGLASRWIEMPRGVLLLQTVPDDPASGAIYLYDRELQVFYFVVFDEGRDDSLTTAEFDELVAEYNLVSWTAHPALLRKAIGKPGMA